MTVGNQRKSVRITSSPNNRAARQFMKVIVVHAAIAIFAACSISGGEPSAYTARLQAFVRQDSSNARDLKLTVLRYSPDHRTIVVRFENLSRRPVNLLRPLDGSEWGWHLPFYDVQMTDSAGKSVPLGGRCGVSGLYSDAKWPEDYRFQILPGDACERHVDIAREHELSGKFSVRFRYTYDSTVASASRDSGIQYPQDLWSGSTASEPLEIVIPEPAR